MIDRKSISGHGAGGCRSDSCAAIASILFRLDSLFTATAREKSYRVGAGEQNPIELSERMNHAIEFGSVGWLGETYGWKQQHGCAHAFKARKQFARLLQGARDNDAFSLERSCHTHAPVPRLSRSSNSAAPPSRNFCATRLPIASASEGNPESFSHKRCAPSAESRATSSKSSPCSIRPHAPIGTWQPPPSPARAERSAVTALRLPGSSSAAKARRVSASAVRASIPIAP